MKKIKQMMLVFMAVILLSSVAAVKVLHTNADGTKGSIKYGLEDYMGTLTGDIPYPLTNPVHRTYELHCVVHMEPSHSRSQCCACCMRSEVCQIILHTQTRGILISNPIVPFPGYRTHPKI